MYERENIDTREAMIKHRRNNEDNQEKNFSRTSHILCENLSLRYQKRKVNIPSTNIALIIGGL